MFAVVQTEEKPAKRAKAGDVDYSEEMKCGICLDFLFQPVTTMPCLHSFCGGCFSPWMKRSGACPACMKEVTEVRRNPSLNNMIEKYLAKFPEKRRPQTEYDSLQKLNVITTETVVLSEFRAGIEKEEEKKAPPPQPAIPSRPAKRAGRHMPEIMSESEDSEYDFDDDNSDDSSQEEAKNESDLPESELEALQAEERPKTCDFCRVRQIPFNERGIKCVLCGALACHQCHVHRSLAELRLHKVTAVPEMALNQNKYEQKLLADYLEENAIQIPKLFKAMIREVIKKKINYTDCKLFLLDEDSLRKADRAA